MRLSIISPVLALLVVSGCAIAPAPGSPPSPGNSTTPVPTVPTDIDGDGVADSLTQKRVNGQWELTVVTASGTSRHVFDSAGGPDDPEYVGVAPLDLVPGSEVVYSGPEEGLNYRVLTWRNGGLVTESSPNGHLTWAVGDEFGVNTGYAFSEKDGQRKLVTSESGGGDVGEVTFVEYTPVSGAWAAQRTWTESLSTEQVASLCLGFCGVTLTPLKRK
ncbi:MAG: hypothetical protein LWW77_10425 [Propionibacteriales bacterium]|nr:hypothetical protein [Propionibacteriales bacterium]